MELSEKTVFITGGARRLGRATALHLWKQKCKLVVHYNTSTADALSLQTETGCQLFRADFSAGSIRDLQTRLSEEVGDIDILINNASSFTHASWKEVGETEWDRDLSVNLKTPFFLSQHFGKRMKVMGAGKILNLADIAAVRGYTNYLPYSVAKAGIALMTAALARVLAPEVQVNAIAPGTILFVEGMPEEAKQKVIANIPAKRTGTVEEFLRTVDFLLRDVDYITGQTLVLDGGRTLTW